MAFTSPRLRVALATAHLALMDVRNVLTIGRVFDPIDLGNDFCRTLGIERPKIAVCGLNPHAGENGLFRPLRSALLSGFVVAQIVHHPLLEITSNQRPHAAVRNLLFDARH
jgi:hypothetical protein